MSHLPSWVIYMDWNTKNDGVGGSFIDKICCGVGWKILERQSYLRRQMFIVLCFLVDEEDVDSCCISK